MLPQVAVFSCFTRASRRIDHIGADSAFPKLALETRLASRSAMHQPSCSRMRTFQQNRLALGVPGYPGRSIGRAAAVVTVAKLIKAANRPASSKKGGIAKKPFELNVQKLCTDSEYVPTRQVGPVDVTVKSGEWIAQPLCGRQLTRPSTNQLTLMGSAAQPARYVLVGISGWH